ncbi:MAG: hypothetical protein K6U80_12855 [Firmicutes bacterium]|nr:hypothetical protein [Bacillota bacterium]
MTRMKYGLKIFFIVIAALLLNATLVWAGETEGTVFDVSGSLEVGVFSQTANDDFFLLAYLPPGAIPVTVLGNNLSLRTDLQIIPNDQVKAKLRLGYRSDSSASSPQNETVVLSRGFIDFSPGSVYSLRLGKQRLAWGTGYAWNPTNLLDLPRNAFTASDDPEGIMAVRNDLKLGPVTGQLVVTPGDDWENSGKAVRLSASPGGVDLTLGWVEMAKGGLAASPHATTFDFACSLAGVGLHGEAVYQAEGNPRLDKKDILNYLLGVDYSFPGGFIVALEYYHNDTAFANAAEAQAYIATNFTPSNEEEVIEVINFLTNLANNGGVTRDHYFLRCSKAFGENTNTELLLVYNATDSSYAAQPELEYTWKQATTLYLKGLVTQGAADSEANLLPIKSRFELGVKVSF